MSRSLKILVVGPSWVGDMVMAQTLFITLKRIFHGHWPEIDVLAPAWSRPILARMPEVNRAIDMPVGHGQVRLADRRALARQLRASRYDWAIVLPNSLKSALIPLLARIPRRTGWVGEQRYGLLNDARRLDKLRYPLMIERFVALAVPDGNPFPRPIPPPALTVDAGNVSAARARFALQDERPVLALCPGAEFGEAKRWPAAHYAAVAAERLAAGWQVWLFGSKNDQPVTGEIAAALPDDQRDQVQDLAGRTELADAVDLLSVADAVVSNDSGLMHIAAALGRALVVVYGSTSPGFTPPLGERVRIERTGVECSPCFQRECPLTEQRYRCLTELAPARVIAALNELVPAA